MHAILGRVQEGAPDLVSLEDVLTFEVATRDLVGLSLRSVADLDLSLPHYRLLLVLHEQGASSSTAVARSLGVVGSTVTRLADRLDASGHLVRGVDPKNRSVVTLELTARGRSVVKKVVTRRRRDLSKALASLDPEERAACAGALEKLHRALADTVPEEAQSSLPL